MVSTSTLRRYPPGPEAQEAAPAGGERLSQPVGSIPQGDPQREIVGAAVALAEAARALNEAAAAIPEARQRASSHSPTGEEGALTARPVMIPAWYLLVTALVTGTLGAAVAALSLRGQTAVPPTATTPAPPAVRIPAPPVAAPPVQAAAQPVPAAPVVAEPIVPPSAASAGTMPAGPAAARKAAAGVSAPAPSPSADLEAPAAPVTPLRAARPAAAPAHRRAVPRPLPDEDGVLEPSFR
jgi:hypothetical protein